MSDERGKMGIDLGCFSGLAVTPRSEWTCGGVLNSMVSQCQIEPPQKMAVTRPGSTSGPKATHLQSNYMTRGEAPCKGPPLSTVVIIVPQEAMILASCPVPLEGGGGLALKVSQAEGA